MPRFVSKHPHFRLEIRPDRSKLMENVNGFTEKVTVIPSLTAEFGTSGLTSYDQEYAMAHFTGRLGAERRDHSRPFYGADPSYTNNEVYGHDGRLVAATEPFTPSSRLSLFDTDAMEVDSEEDREYVVQYLRSSGENGYSYVEIIPQALPAPWPSYDDIGQGAVTKIPSVVRDLGLDPALVAGYERANKNRDGVIAALDKLAESQAATAVEDASLTVEIS
jgi:hypothetical protein